MSANNAIGTGAIVITADADQVPAGLTKASGHLSKWAKDSGKIADAATGGKGLVGSMLGGGRGIAGSVAGSLGTLLGGAGGPLGMALGGGIGAAIGGGLAMSGDFLEKGLHSIKELSHKGRVAESLGVDSGQFTGLELAFKRFGANADAVAPSLTRLGKNVTDATFGVPKAAAAFEMLGLDAARISGLSLDQQFLEVAGAISQIATPAQQAHAAIAVFGKSGGELLEVLQQGSGGLQQFIDKQKAMGTAVGGADMEKVMEAQRAIPKIQAAFDGLWNRIVVAMAPVVTAVGGALTKALERVQPVLRWVCEFAETYFTVWAAVLEEVVDLVGEVAGSIGRWAAELLGLEQKTWTVKGTMLSVFRGIGTGIAYVWDTLKAGAGVFAYVTGFAIDNFATPVLQALDAVAQMAKSIPDQFRPFQVDDMVDGIHRASEEVDRIGQGIRKWGKGAVEGFGDSDKAVQRWFDKLEGKMNDRPKEKGRQPFNLGPDSADLKPTENKIAGALERGSKEAYSAIVRYQTGQLADQQDVPRRQLAAQNEMAAGIKALVKQGEAAAADRDAEEDF